MARERTSQQQHPHQSRTGMQIAALFGSDGEHAAPCWRAAAEAGVAAALLGAAAAVVIATVCWLPDAAASGGAGSVLHAGFFTFLIAHHGGLIPSGAVLDGADVAFAPLGMLCAVAALCWRGGTSLGQSAQLAQIRLSRGDASGEETYSDSVGGETDPIVGAQLGSLLVAVGAQSACYAFSCGLLTHWARFGSTHVALVPTLLASFAVCFVSASLSALRYASLPELPTWMYTGLRAGAAALSTYLLAASALGLGSVLMHHAKVMQLSHEVGGGLSGFPIAMLGVVTIPNVVLAAMAYLSGVGFTVGSGAFFSPLHSTHAVLPAFPLLGALPSGHGGNVLVLVLMAVTLVGAGMVAARILTRDELRLPQSVAAACCSAVTAGVLATVLTVLAGGAVAQGRLHTVGASGWQVGVAVTAEVAFSSALLMSAVVLARHLGSRQPARLLSAVPASLPVHSEPPGGQEHQLENGDVDDHGGRVEKDSRGSEKQAG